MVATRSALDSLHEEDIAICLGGRLSDSYPSTANRFEGLFLFGQKDAESALTYIPTDQDIFVLRNNQFQG